MNKKLRKGRLGPLPTEGFDGPTPVLPLDHIEMWSDTLLHDQMKDTVDAVDVERIVKLDAELARRESHLTSLMLLGQSIDG